jgi:ubiquinone/menaquinone biosynthesis C-methylase UbiE
MIGSRRNIPELMDEPALDGRDVDNALLELSMINRWLGGDRVSREGIKRILGSLPPGRPVTVLDVGAGGSDLSRALAPIGRQFEITALDVNPRVANFARTHGRPVTVIIGSAHALPFPDKSFDLVHLSLFLHHCTDEEARKLLLNLARIARHGIVINDLHRHALAYVSIALLTRLFSRSVFVRHDAPASVLRGFLRGELAALVPARLHPGLSISWHWAFRWCVSIPLTDPTDVVSPG